MDGIGNPPSGCLVSHCRRIVPSWAISAWEGIFISPQVKVGNWYQPQTPTKPGQDLFLTKGETNCIRPTVRFSVKALECLSFFRKPSKGNAPRRCRHVQNKPFQGNFYNGDYIGCLRGNARRAKRIQRPRSWCPTRYSC